MKTHPQSESDLLELVTDELDHLNCSVTGLIIFAKVEQSNCLVKGDLGGSSSLFTNQLSVYFFIFDFSRPPHPELN
jgi:hypothetical protein